MGKYSKIEVEVISGVSAVNYSAALLGAPLHDFAVISLSDILTPLSEIKRKIRAAAEADFVIAFYNPRSKRRTKPFQEALKILQEVRNPETPVGIVKTQDNSSLVKIVSLDELKEEEVDMNTTLIVGNTFTYAADGKMVTPRGYVLSHSIHPLAAEFYERYLSGDGNKGSNTACEYYPCHSHPQNCTFCYCPFYPCGDPSTGGRWIKEKKIWSCEGCTWIHQDDTVQCIQTKLPKLLEKVEDLQDNKKELLKLRRECVYLTK
jgi:precorrin-3B C17-methyltransferase